MKLYAALFTTLCLLSSSVFSDVPNVPAYVSKPFRWVPFAFTAEGKDAYVDQNRITNIRNDNKLINTATILITYEKPVMMKTPKGSIEINSMITVVMVDCREGEILPIEVMYFSQINPQPLDKAEMFALYSPKTDPIGFFAEDPIIKSLCPIPS